MSELYGKLGTVIGEHKCDKDERIAELEGRVAVLTEDRAEAEQGEMVQKMRAEQAEALAKQRLDVQHDMNKQYFGEVLAKQQAEAELEASREMVDELASRIAELEAEKEQWIDQYNRAHDGMMVERRLAEQAEAELAKWKWALWNSARETQEALDALLLGYQASPEETPPTT